MRIGTRVRNVADSSASPFVGQVVSHLSHGFVVVEWQNGTRTIDNPVFLHRTGQGRLSHFFEHLGEGIQ